MNKLCKETGFLNEAGNKITTSLKKALDNLLSTDDVNDMSESEFKTFGCCLASMVADSISNKIQSQKEIITMFDGVSDQEFESYLKNKYGKNYMFVSLSDAEYKRLDRVMIAKIDNFSLSKKDHYKVL